MSLIKRIANLENAKKPVSEYRRIQALADQTPDGMEARRLGTLAYEKLRQAGTLPDDPSDALMMAANETEEGREAAFLGARALVGVIQREQGG